MKIDQVKKIAPLARRKMIDAIERKAAEYGIYHDKVYDIQNETGDSITINGKVFDKKIKHQRNIVLNKMKSYQANGYRIIIEEIAYTWFNRFCAIRYMEINKFLAHDLNVVSSLNPAGIASKALDVFGLNLKKIQLLLEKSDLENLWKVILLAQCHELSKIMPFLFVPVDDFSELLFPSDITHDDSVLTLLVKDLPDEVWKEAEIIGWLYQYYISEKKDEVINRRSMVRTEEIPAATQLFTPHWIVQYMIDNSLGRLWMLNYPDSRLCEKMKFYIAPSGVKEFIKIKTPEELKICDPACGSGHLLIYAFDLLYSIYEECGYTVEEAITNILEKNLFGIEIDKRAGELAAFSLLMKAREKHKYFFKDVTQPNICILSNIVFTENELIEYKKNVDVTDFDKVSVLLNKFISSDNNGSLIRPNLENVEEIFSKFESLECPDNLFFHTTHSKVIQILNQARYLTCRYHIVIANPPYAGSRYMNLELRNFAKREFPNSKTDLFAMFIERINELTLPYGIFSIVCPYVWMFISKYETFRKNLLASGSISSMVRLEYNAFEPATVPVSTWTFSKDNMHNGVFIDLSEFKGVKNQAPRTLDAIRNSNTNYRFSACIEDFSPIPGMPVAYQAGPKLRALFNSTDSLDSLCDFTGSQNITGDNDSYIRYHWEVDRSAIGQNQRWVTYQKGGGLRKWYGLDIFVVDWSEDARRFYASNPTSNLLKEKYWYREGITYSELTSNTNSFRFLKENSVYDKKGPSFHPHEDVDLYLMLAICNSNIAKFIFSILNPTMSLQVRDVKNLPIVTFEGGDFISKSARLVDISKEDWIHNELSLDFKKTMLFDERFFSDSLESSIRKLTDYQKTVCYEARDLEEKINADLIRLYGLEGEVLPDVSMGEITLFGNPSFRFEKIEDESELERMLQAEHVKEFISFCVGCIFSRYEINKLSFQSEDINQKIKRASLYLDSLNHYGILPVVEGGWFSNDLTNIFRELLKILFKEESFSENIKFIEKSISTKIDKYFQKKFFLDHKKAFKQRPVYWLFTSPKKHFSVIMNMHKYNSDSLGLIRRKYLHELQNKLERQELNLERDGGSRELSKIREKLSDLRDYDELLKHVAGMKVELSLADGVKVNYQRFYELGLVAKI